MSRETDSTQADVRSDKIGCSCTVSSCNITVNRRVRSVHKCLEEVKVAERRSNGGLTTTDQHGQILVSVVAFQSIATELWWVGAIKNLHPVAGYVHTFVSDSQRPMQIVISLAAWMSLMKCDFELY